jgi:hypothetical protein
MPTRPLRILSSLQTVLTCPIPSPHVGTVWESFGTMRSGLDRTLDAETWPPAIPNCPVILDSSIAMQPSAYIHSKTSNRSSAYGPGALGVLVRLPGCPDGIPWLHSGQTRRSERPPSQP